jgi:hypothetical protein
MMKHLIFALLATSLAATSHAQQSIESSPKWAKVADGVYESMDSLGNSTRMAFGEAGAAFDRDWLTSNNDAIKQRLATGRATEGDEELLRSNEQALEGMNFLPVMAGLPSLNDSMSGDLCGRFSYSFDSHLVVGKTGALAVERTAFSGRQPGPPMTLNDGTFFARAIVTPNGGSAITTTNSATLSGGGTVPVLSIASYNEPGLPSGILSPFYAASCTAQTYAYISLSTGAGCVGIGPYVSRLKTYSTCVSAP